MKLKIFTAIKRTSAGILLFAFLVSGLAACDGQEKQNTVLTPSPKVQENQSNGNTSSPEMQGGQESTITDSPEVQEQEEDNIGYEVKGDVVYVTGRSGFGYGFGREETGGNGVVLWYVDGQDAKKMFIEKDVQLNWLEDDMEGDVSNYSSNVARCLFLSEISVDKENLLMYAKDGLLYLYGPHEENGLYACPVARKGRVKIPDGEKIIWSCALNGCSDITSVYIPKSIQGIGDAAFGDMMSCKSIKVSEKNRYYKSIDGVLYTKDGKVLLAYPAGKKQKEFRIPKGVKYIASGAFMEADYLEKVILPESVKFIYESAFRSCDSLSSVEIRGEVEYLAYKAFYECHYIKNRKKLPKPTDSSAMPENGWRYEYNYFDLSSKDWITGYRGLGR